MLDIVFHQSHSLDPIDRSAAAVALREMAVPERKKFEKEIIKALKELLRDCDDRVVVDAIEAVISCGQAGKGCLPEIFNIFLGDDDELMLKALHALTELKPESRDWLGAWDRAFNHHNKAVLYHLCRLAPEVHGERAEIVEKLASLIDCRWLEIAWAAVESLGRMGPESLKCEEKLKGALSSEDSYLSECASRALSKLGVEHGIIEEGSCTPWEKEEKQRDLEDLVAGMSNCGNFEKILQELNLYQPSIEQPVSGQVLQACLDLSVTRQRPEAPPEILGNILRGKDPNLVWAALLAVGSYGPAASVWVPAIRHLRNHKDPSVSNAAMKALRRIER